MAGAVKGAGKAGARRLFAGARRTRFLAKLAETANVTAAARAAGVGVNAVYNCRSRDPGFRAEWAAALCEGYASLELKMLERAINGVPTLVKAGDGTLRKGRETSDRLGLGLLAMHRKSVDEARARMAAAAGGEGADDPARDLIEKIDEMAARLMGEAGPEDGNAAG